MLLVPVLGWTLCTFQLICGADSVKLHYVCACVIDLNDCYFSERLHNYHSLFSFTSHSSHKITYAVQSYSGYLLEQQIDRLQAILNKAKKWRLFSVLYNLRKILENQDCQLSIKLSPILNTVLTVYSLQ